jgi:cellulose synthase/poly-beta-1,6-N-acetylglucosamine synthase-like glycosyltransferase
LLVVRTPNLLDGKLEHFRSLRIARAQRVNADLAPFFRDMPDRSGALDEPRNARAIVGVPTVSVSDALRLVAEASFLISALGLLVVGGSFLYLVGVNILELAMGKRLGRPLRTAVLDAAALPRVLVQIPVYNEPEMVADALRAAVALDWPRDKLHIQLLDDSTDSTCATAAAVADTLRARGHDILHLRRANRSGYKGGALAAGLARSDAPFVAILDADFRPPAHWLRAVVPMLVADPAASFVQSRCEFANYRTNFLTRVQGMMLDAHFVIEQATRFRAGWLFQFNGTGAVWRREAIDAAGGWSGESLCEDLDLTVRAEIAGWHGLFAMEPAVPGLVPAEVGHWRVQQRRWSNGFVQVARKLVGQVWTTDWPLGRKISASLLIFVQVFYPCVAIASLSLLAAIFLRGGDPSAYAPHIGITMTLIAITAVALTLVPYLGLRRGSLARYAATLASLVPMMIYISLSNAPAILGAAFGATETWKRTPKTALEPELELTETDELAEAEAGAASR